MSKKFVVTKDVVAALTASLVPFKNEKNKVVFKVGMNAHGEDIEAAAQLTNGSMQVLRGFMVKKPKDFKEGELYASFNVKAVDFIAVAEKLTAYNADLEFEVGDAALTLSVPKSASVSLSLVADSEVDQPLPDENDTVSCAQLTGAELSALLTRGASAGVKEDTKQSFGDRTMILVGEKLMKVYSSDGSSIIEKAEKSGIMAACNTEILSKLRISEKSASLKGSEKEAFEKAAVAALQEKKLDDFVSEQGLDVKSYAYGLSTAQIGVLKALISGAQTVQMKQTGKYLSVRCGNCAGTFALAALNASHDSMYKTNVEQWYAQDAAATVVVDKADLTRAIEVSELSNTLKTGSKITPIHILLEKDSLLSCGVGDSRANVKISAAAGDTGMGEIYLNPKYLKMAVDTLPSGNVRLMFNGLTSPFALTSGGLEDEKSAQVWILPVNPSAVGSGDEEEEEQSSESEASEG